ncbi:hypothetical protein [Merismopedia glauca]|uniref:hypothetical protein n=1 Tax=Merismopedia glauca TaxID=292586 RepID=UPI0011B25C3C|nr:hypothetical protein [Merismopedia glauca]
MAIAYAVRSAIAQCILSISQSDKAAANISNSRPHTPARELKVRSPVQCSKKRSLVVCQAIID